MLLQKEDRVRHYPAKEDRFEFDEEVAEVFPDMARRSLPLFYETHDLHACLCRRSIESGRDKILDIGASRGAFLKALDNHYGIEALDARALDYSQPMVERLIKEFPSVRVRQEDITSEEFLSSTHTYDIVNMAYVLQFVPLVMQPRVIAKVIQMVRPGGILFFGAKLAVHGQEGQDLHDHYINWRVGNGYTREEIEAKTKALAGSMWPISEAHLRHFFTTYGIVDVIPTTRHTVFANFMCLKGGIRDD